MKEADGVLEDEELIDRVYEALGRRCPQSRTRGRKGTPAEVVLRLMVLKHVRDWSFETLEREVRANLVYRRFTRIGGEKVPDAKTLARVIRALGPQGRQQINQRLVKMAQEHRVVRGRKMRVDTTVVETNIHYPTESSLLGEGVRVLTRTMQKIQAKVGEVGKKVRNRIRSVGHRLLEIGRASRRPGEAGEAQWKKAYGRLLSTTGQVVAQAEGCVEEAGEAARRRRGKARAKLESLKKELETMVPRVRQVMRQCKARVFGGDPHAAGKIVSLFEESTETIRRGQASKPTEFGKMIKIQEAENQIITDYQVYAERPSDADLLVPAVEKQREQLGRVPAAVAADAGFYSAANEATAQAMGVKRISIPSRSTKSAARRRYQKQRWFRPKQKWRTGCEGRISVLKRRHGLNRCRYRGLAGTPRWVGLGVIADNLISLGPILAQRPRK